MSVRNVWVVLCLALTMTACSAKKRSDSGGGDGGSDASNTDGSSQVLADGGALPDLNFDGPHCETNDDCQNDSHCVSNVCVPWGPNETDPSCVHAETSGTVSPLKQCEWPAGATDFPVPTSVSVDHTPIVANIGIVPLEASRSRPSIIFISDDGYGERPGCRSNGVLRVLDGATCGLMASKDADEDRVVGQVAPAVADLDNDGVPEIVAVRVGGGLIAFHWNATTSTLDRVWTSTNAMGAADTTTFACRWGGLTIGDLDGEPGAEIVFADGVWNSSGVKVATIPGWVQSREFVHAGSPVTIADVDLDGRGELVMGNGVFTWDGTSSTLSLESYWVGRAHDTGGDAEGDAEGFVAVADFGNLSEDTDADHLGHPELIYAHYGDISVHAYDGAHLFSLGDYTGGWNGGPPTIADFDGDSKPEVGVAFGTQYVVFDIIEGMTLWSQPSQDNSSKVTGSSVFDFNGDGRAEVVYGDECYTRIYDGMTGEVEWSQPRFSATWTENPVVADVDDDNSAEVVVVSGAGDNTCASLSPTYCPSFDPVFRGLRCDSNADCPGNNCVEHLCRCEDNSDCGEAYECTTPISGTAGTGNVCRSHFNGCTLGVTVYRDARDRWSGARNIWNQHSYFITNINDDLSVPVDLSSLRNWENPDLNNFRQNVPGSLSANGADLTVRDLVAFCDGPNTRLSADVCNRGDALTDLGVEIIFRQVGGDELCRLRTTEPIGGGDCTSVTCVAPVPADGEFEGLVDPDGRIGECSEGNNEGRGLADCLM